MLAATFLAALIGSSLASFYSPRNSQALFKRANISSGCSSTEPASCTNTSAVSDLCCFQAPGVHPATGPDDSWTIHGLWPDHCDGTFDSTCDASRAYTDLGGLLTAQGSDDTLDFMNTFWKDNNGNDESFWEHGQPLYSVFTLSQALLLSTLNVECLPIGSPTGAEAVIYLNTVALPTYQWLAAAGITPSPSTTHTLADLTAAIKAGFGFIPALDCTSGAVNQISYYYHLQGSVIDGIFVAMDAPKAGSCPSTGINYLTKGPTTTTMATTTTGTQTSTTTTATGPPTVIPTKAIIHAVQDGAQIGGLLSLGTWSTQTLATYTLTGATDNFTLKSSKGSCGVSSGVFACGSVVTSTTFSAVISGNLLLLASNGDTNFSSDNVPSGTIVYAVNTGSDDTEVYTLSIVST
ncbi:ribonuclease [Mycena rosella]|uniref:Ribonuclease T2-like n=1 Tax=Mycena rosella TaxID=1033263 RepID=A0AAD7GP76_MYCRO|nr:ribonuclease [Mycena rosella]